MPTSASTVRAVGASRLTRPTTTATAIPMPPIHVSAVPLSACAPQPISFSAIAGSPSALFSGTKKSLPTNQAPTTTRLKIAKPMIATAG